MEPLTISDSAGLATLEAEATCWSWSESQYRSSLASGSFGWGIRRPGDAAGPWVAFILLSQVLDEVSLLNVATHPDWRRRGLARQLLEQTLPILRNRGAATVFLEVRTGNAAAIRLYRDLGFSDSGLRRGYYPALEPASAAATAVTPSPLTAGPSAGREDALLMQVSLLERDLRG